MDFGDGDGRSQGGRSGMRSGADIFLGLSEDDDRVLSGAVGSTGTSLPDPGGGPEYACGPGYGCTPESEPECTREPGGLGGPGATPGSAAFGLACITFCLGEFCHSYRGAFARTGVWLPGPS